MSVQFGFLFLDKKHFVDQAFKFSRTFLQYSELFSEVFVLLIVSRYEQIDGVAMGSPLGPLMANTVMCSIEEKLESEDKLLSFYKRYVDDTLAAAVKGYFNCYDFPGNIK